MEMKMFVVVLIERVDFRKFDVCWMVVKIEKQNGLISVLVGVSHRLTQSTKVDVDRDGETSALKRWNVGGVVIFGSYVFHQRPLKDVSNELCDVECCRRRSRCSSFKVSEPTDFWTFVDHFIVAFWIESATKTLMGKVTDWVKKKKS